MKYNMYIFLLTCGLNVAQSYAQQAPILTHQILRLVDGLSIGIDGNVFAMLLKLRTQMTRVVNGQESNKEGYYCIDETWYTLSQLAEYEEQVRERHPVNTVITKQLDQCLHSIKHMFSNLVQPFMAQAKKGKDQMLILINEWAEKAGRTDSFLCTWGGTPIGLEQETFYKEITSVSQFEQFAKDLINFLESLMLSCPKAQKQFMALVKPH